MKYNINNLDMFSKYYIKNSEVYSKKTNIKKYKNKYNIVTMLDDKGIERKVKIETLTQHNINVPEKVKDLKGEVWKPIKRNDKDKYNYSISNYGRIKLNGSYCIFEKLVSNRTNKYGYIISKIQNKKVYLHRIIYEYFIGNIPKGYHIHHIDGNKQNNNIDNLQCISPSEHNKVGHREGLYKNSYINRMKLTEDERKAIASKYKPYKYTIPMLAKEYKISESTVKRIIKKYKKD